MSPDLDTRVRAANPVRTDQLEQLFGDDASARLLREIRDRRVVPMRTSETDQQFETPTPTEESPWWRRGWVAALSAAAVVLLIIGVVALVQSGDDPPVGSEVPVTTVAPESAEALAIAEAFMEARDAADVEATFALFSDDVHLSSLARTAEELVLWYAWDEAYGADIVSFECRELADARLTRVGCTYATTNAWAEALGVGPFSGSSYLLTMSDGRITSMVHNFNDTEFLPQVWSPVSIWIAERHPDDWQVMRRGQAPILTEESIELWRQHTEEFVAEMTGASSESSDE